VRSVRHERVRRDVESQNIRSMYGAADARSHTPSFLRARLRQSRTHPSRTRSSGGAGGRG
jgi:hypothetical protein